MGISFEAVSGTANLRLVTINDLASLSTLGGMVIFSETQREILAHDGELL
ncbi:MAG: hypothetical protein ACK5QS_09265 [Pseudanabaenaceae cyanobacterium]